MGISVNILAYEEAENLKILLPKLKVELLQINEEYEIIVVDAKISTDCTEEICKQNKVKYVRQEFEGFGDAYKTAIKYSKKDKFLIMDADGSHNPKNIKDIYNKFVKTNCDAVIASRYIKNGLNKDTNSSIIMSKILNLTYRIFLNIKINDMSSGFRMYKTEQLKKIDIKSKNYNVQQEIIVKLMKIKKDFEVKEVPIIFSKRKYGTSKRKLFIFIIDYIKTLFYLFYIKNITR